MKAIVLGTAVVVALSAAGFVRQRTERAELHAAIALAELESQELAALRAQQQRLLAARVSEDQLQRLRADRVAMQRLRSELDSLQHVAAVKQAAVAALPATAPDILPPPTATDGPVSEGFLRNLGCATPATAVETALWAATGGDLETLVNTLALEGEARAKAEQFLASLPSSARDQYRTPEHLVALLTAREIPLVGIQIMPARKEEPAGTRVLARMPGPDGKLRTIALTVRQFGSEWKMVVPASAVEKFARSLAGEKTSAAMPATVSASSAANIPTAAK